jgi:hypothetical protein
MDESGRWKDITVSSGYPSESLDFPSLPPLITNTCKGDKGRLQEVACSVPFFLFHAVPPVAIQCAGSGRAPSSIGEDVRMWERNWLYCGVAWVDLRKGINRRRDVVPRTRGQGYGRLGGRELPSQRCQGQLWLSGWLRNNNLGAGERAQQVRTLAVLTQDWSSVPSTHTKQLTISHSSSSRGDNGLFSSSSDTEYLYIHAGYTHKIKHMHTHTHNYTHTTILTQPHTHIYTPHIHTHNYTHNHTTTHTYTHTQPHIHIYTHNHTHIYTHTTTHTHTHNYTHTQPYNHTHTHNHTHIHTHTTTHMYSTHTHNYTHTQPYNHTHTHIHTHTHT